MPQGLIKDPSKKTISMLNKIYWTIIFLGIVMLFTCNPVHASVNDTQLIQLVKNTK